MTPTTALHIAELVVADGFDVHAGDVDAVCDLARNHQVSDTLLSIVGDRDTAAPVRERALGRIVVEVSRDVQRPRLPEWVTSRVATRRRPLAA